MTSLRSRLLSALVALLALNGVFFGVGLRTISRMNRVNALMYDKVVMSSTYAQMAKNDFWRFTEAVNTALTETNAKTETDRWASADDAAATLADDLQVVKERLLAPEDAASIEAFLIRWQAVKAAGAEYHKKKKAGQLNGENMLAASRAWMANSERRAALKTLSDLTDKVVADGYSFRMESQAHAAFTVKTAAICSVFLFLIDVLCISYILFSVLPRLRLLAATCLEIASGQFAKRVDIKARDEFGSLADSFNMMLEVIRDREDRLNEQLVTTSAMVNSLGQGFLMFDAQGICLDAFSKSCFDLLEIMPAGKTIAEVLRISEQDFEMFAEWIRILFSETIEFEDAARLGPTEFKHSAGRNIFLEYKPVFSLHGGLKSVVVIATDRSEAMRAQRLADAEQAFSRMVVRMMRNRGDFMRLLNRMNDLIRGLRDQPLAQALRTLHNIKGAAATYSLTKLADAAHEAETALLTLAENLVDTAGPVRAQAETLLKVYQEILEELKTLSGFSLSHDSFHREFLSEDVFVFYQRLKIENSSLSEFFLENFVMEPAESHFASFEETVAQIARRQGKKVAPLKFEGGDLPVLSEIYTPLFQSFVHVFRNSVDHGVELPEARIAAGKPERATIEVKFSRVGERMEIVVRDDGRGIDMRALRAKLEERGVACADESDARVLQRLFLAGFSTAAEISEISGRGVGLDSLMNEAKRLGGEAEISSIPGRGTSVRVVVPYVRTPVESKQTRSA